MVLDNIMHVPSFIPMNAYDGINQRKEQIMKREMIRFTWILLAGLIIPPPDAYCRPGHVFVKPHALANGMVISGHWRVSARTGFTWIGGVFREGHWRPGYWKPVGKAPRGKVWVPGYAMSDGKWIDGYWRPKHKRGWIWIQGFTAEDGHYIKGYWKKK